MGSPVPSQGELPVVPCPYLRSCLKGVFLFGALDHRQAGEIHTEDVTGMHLNFLTDRCEGTHVHSPTLGVLSLPCYHFTLKQGTSGE